MLEWAMIYMSEKLHTDFCWAVSEYLVKVETSGSAILNWTAGDVEMNTGRWKDGRMGVTRLMETSGPR